MKRHQVIFLRIKEMLTEHFADELQEYDDGSHLVIGDSEIWIEVDDFELTIGYGPNHRHYHSEYEDIGEAVEDFFNLLTRKIRTTAYYKEAFLYKLKVEIEGVGGEYKKLSTTLTWLFPFWKRTKAKVSIQEGLVEFKKLEKAFSEIKNLLKTPINENQDPNSYKQ